jgi:hypothetical protein
MMLLVPFGVFWGLAHSVSFKWFIVPSAAALLCIVVAFALGMVRLVQGYRSYPGHSVRRALVSVGQ